MTEISSWLDCVGNWSHSGEEKIRVAALVEAASVTGPAKNLIEFARRAGQPQPGSPGAMVSLAAFHRGPLDLPNALVAAARESGIPVDVIAERRAFDFGVVPQLRAMVAARRPHLIQTHNYKSHFLVRMAGLHRLVPWIAFHHGYTATDARVRLYNQLDRWSLRAASRVVTVCRAFAADLRRMGIPAARIAVQHNTVRPFIPAAPDEVLRPRLLPGVAPDALIILSVGRLSREKGHLDLVDAIAALRRETAVPFCLVLVGDGPDRAAIERKCARLGIADGVVFAGHRKDVGPYYSIADIVVLPSHTEGSPNVLLEAMAAGLPVVAASVGGVPEIAAGGENALLVASRDPGAMARAIARLLADEPLRRRLGASARRITARHSPEAYCQSLLQIYGGVLQEAHSRHG